MNDKKRASGEEGSKTVTSSDSSVADSSEYREQIREIWQPLYNAGFSGSKQIHAQEMAYLITAATDETEALLTQSNVEVLDRLAESLPEELSDSDETFSKFDTGYNSALRNVKAIIDREREGLK